MTRCAAAMRAGMSREERRDLGLDAEPRIGLARRARSPRARACCDDARAAARARPASSCDRRRHDVGHDPRALAAAEHERAGGCRRRRAAGYGSLAAVEHGRPHRIAGMDEPCRPPAATPCTCGKPVAMRVDARRQQPVGAAHARRSARGSASGCRAARPRSTRRHRRIAAEADDGRRLDPAEHRRSLPARPAPARQRPRWPCATGERAAERRRGDRVDVVGRKRPGHSASARSSVARCTAQPRARQRVRQRLGRKQMAAGAAGRQQDGSAPSPSAASALRPAAGTMRSRCSERGRRGSAPAGSPSPSASEISDEPP